jgi:hypothetical protein
MKERERERDKPERIHERSQERSDSMIPWDTNRLSDLLLQGSLSSSFPAPAIFTLSLSFFFLGLEKTRRFPVLHPQTGAQR